MALPLLQLGDQNELVSQLRAKLIALGFAVSATTSDLTIFDSAVQSAVVALQQKVGLPADGIVNDPTWAALGADVGAAAGGWGKIILMLAVAGGLYWWWRKRQQPYGEFGRRLHGYGDAIDDRLLEQNLQEPLLLAERGDCRQAAKLLTKWRRYSVRGDASPKARGLFKTVAKKVTAGCPKEVREALEDEREFEPSYGPGVLTDLEAKMRAARSQRFTPERNRLPGDLEPWLTSQPTVRRGARPWEKETPTLYPDIRGSRGGKIIYETRDGREVTGRTVGKNDPASSTVLVEDASGTRHNIQKTSIIGFIPHYGPAQKVQVQSRSAETKAAQALYSRERRAAGAEARAETLRLENEMMRRAAGYRKEGDRMVRLKGRVH